MSHGSRVTRVTGQLADWSRGSLVIKCDPLSALVSPTPFSSSSPRLGPGHHQRRRSCARDGDIAVASVPTGVGSGGMQGSDTPTIYVGDIDMYIPLEKPNT